MALDSCHPCPHIPHVSALPHTPSHLPFRVRVYHVITHAPPGWQQGSGFITLDMMKERLFPAGPDSLALMCGPPGLLNHVCLPGFKAMGYEESRMVVF